MRTANKKHNPIIEYNFCAQRFLRTLSHQINLGGMIMSAQSYTNTITRMALCVLAMTMLATPAYASGSGMPWEGPLEQIVDSITGPVARAAAVIAIVIAGVTIIFSEGGGGVRKLAFVGLGIAIMFAAVSFFLDFFGFAGGALI